jgi:hypothetical protein
MLGSMGAAVEKFSMETPMGAPQVTIFGVNVIFYDATFLLLW